MRPDAERNRERILSAALDLVTRRGPSVSMNEIAAAAGVAVGTLYRHHPTKADLVAAVVEDRVGQLADRTEQAAERVDAGADVFETLASMLLDVAQQHADVRTLKAAAALLGLPVHESSDGRIPPLAAPAAQRAITALDAVLDRARSSGAVRPDLSVDDLGMLLSAVPDDPAHRSRYFEIVIAGLRP